jgi:hypothetical protein
MPGFVVHQGAVVQCAHAGAAQPTAVSPQVTVMGMPIVTITAPYSVAGCTFPAMTSGGSPPCVTAQWSTGATRVTSAGSPVVLQASTSVCSPNGTPLMIISTQTRVSAT